MTAFHRRALRLFVLVVGFLAAGQAIAERRVALIIGNAKYEHADTLANTINDANAVAALLKNAGFDVVNERRDIGVVEFKRAVREFLMASADADIAVVYYSGHGIEYGGVNYLVPVDAKLASDFDVEDEAIALDRLIAATEGAKRLSLIILDACRENPFARAQTHVATKRSIGGRLVSVEPTGTDTLIAYAAKAGSVSYDGVGANSPFTTALIKYIATPGLDIRIALGKVRDEVLASTGNRQEPFVYGSLGGGLVSLAPAPSTKTPAAASAGEGAAAADYEMAERVGTREGWQAFLAAHASGFYADLARAQLAKLSTTAPAAAKVQMGTPVLPSSPVLPDPAQPAASGQLQVALTPPAAPATKPIQSDPAFLPKDQVCRTEAARLAQLRQDPSPEPAEKFASELACEDLRPQVRRFLESLGVDPAKRQASVTTAPKRQDDAQTCKQAAEELSHLRATLDREAARKFARELKCEALRPQTARLLDSIGD